MIKLRQRHIFFIGFMLLFLLGIIRNVSVSEYVYDAVDYYMASQSFTNSGQFSILNYANTYRGIYFPLILAIYSLIGSALGIDAGVAILFGNALFTSFIIVIVIPKIMAFKTRNRSLIWGIVPLIVYAFFWSDLFVYPLTDMYALGFCAISAYIILQIKDNLFQIPFVFLLGGILYVTYNIRTIYLFSSIGLILILFYKVIFKEHFCRLKVLLVSVILAFGIVSAGTLQAMVNSNLHSRYTMRVITDDLNGGELFTSQLYMGFLYDRYETYVGDPNVYPNVQMNFIDRAGVQIISNDHLGEGFSGLGEYIVTVLRHPVDYIGIIMRHIASALYVPWNRVYLTDLKNGKTLLALLNYSIVFYFGLKMSLYCKNLKGNEVLKSIRVLCMIAIILPCIAILPGAIELRFFMPMYLCAYLFIFLKNNQICIRYLKTNWKSILICYILVYCLLSGYWGGIMSSAQSLPQLLN